MSYADLAKLVNEKTIPKTTVSQNAEPLKVEINNTDSIESIENTKKLLIGEREARDRGAIGKRQTSENGSSSASQYGTGNRGNTYRAYDSRSSSSPYKSTYSYQTSKTETKEERATRIVDKKIAAIWKEKKRYKEENWDLVSIINEDAERKERLRRMTPAQLKRSNKKGELKETFLRFGFEVARQAMIMLHMKGER